MKKIILGCAAVLLSLGLLAGCNNDAPIEDAVLINVDSAASVEVGDTLTLSYSVSPEKATVVAASDNQGIVTAEAEDGLLYLTGVTEGKATVTLVGTYKKYADANVNIAVEVISEATEKTEPGTQVPALTLSVETELPLEIPAEGDPTPTKIEYTVLPEEAEAEVTMEVTSGTEHVTLLPPEEAVEASLEEAWYVTPVTAGTSEIKVSATAEGYTSAEETITVTIKAEGSEEEPGPDTTKEGLIGSFDFSSNEATNSGISTTNGLDEFWEGEELYLGARQHSSVYLGCDGGALSGETNCIKLGTTSAGGLLQLKFELGTCVSKVVVTAHSWTTGTANTLTVNGVSEECSISGEPEAITYTIADDLTYLVTMESNVGLTVHGIEIYGTYEPDKVEAITSLSLSADADELEIGDTAEISVSWEPATTVFDIDELEWTSSNSDAVSVTSTPDGAEVHALDATDETTITATATNGVYATCVIKVNALEEEGLYGIYNFSKLTYSYTKEQTSGSSTHHLTTSELETQLGVAWTGASGNSDPVTSVTDTSRIDDYNDTTSGWVQGENSLGYLKTGSSSAVGYMSLSLDISVVKVVVNCHSWTTGTTNQKVSVVDSGDEQVASTSGTATDLTFEIDSTNSLKIQGNLRVFIASIALYTA